MNRPRPEVAERVHSVRGATWYVQRSRVNELGVVLKRLPPSADSTGPGLSFVLVHGLGVSSHYFEFLAAELSRSGTVWLVDLPGYGDAPVPRSDVPISTHALILADVLRSAGIESPVLVGHSMGAQVVTSVVAQRELRVTTLVLLSPVSNVNRRTSRQQIWDLAKDSFAEPWRARINAVHEYLLRGRLPYYLRQVPHMIGYAIEEVLPGVTAKTLVVTGDEDPIVPVDWASTVAASAPNGTLHVVPGAHVVMYSAPAALAARIVNHAR
jgi:pimeloyl-ACP methyl ester carboxylesterase